MNIPRPMPVALPLKEIYPLDQFRKSLGQTVKSMREAKGMTLENFAREIGVCRHTARRIEHGTGPTDAYQLMLIMGLFNAPITAFLAL